MSARELVVDVPFVVLAVRTVYEHEQVEDCEYRPRDRSCCSLGGCDLDKGRFAIVVEQQFYAPLDREDASEAEAGLGERVFGIPDVLFAG